MVEMQREIARKMSCVLDGRDIGTHVLPDAPFKFFVTASSRVRAKRRYDELRQKGYDVEYDNVLQEIEERDYNLSLIHILQIFCGHRGRLCHVEDNRFRQ